MFESAEQLLAATSTVTVATGILNLWMHTPAEAAAGYAALAMIAWGDEEAIMRRVAEHRAAGADHVCLQVLAADSNALPRAEWRRLAAALS